MISSLAIQSLGMGRHLCPECQGGSSREKSLNIWRMGGNVLAKCHRNSCGAFGKLPVSVEALELVPVSPTEGLRPFLGDRGPLESFDIEAFTEKFGFVPADAEVSGETYILPILSPTGVERGVVQRSPASWGWDRFRPSEAPKSMIWKAKEEPMISWAVRTSPSDAFEEARRHIFVVEDQISAAMISQNTPYLGVALLGTHLTADAVREMQRHATGIVIALDADAARKAYILARKWGDAFYHGAQVLMLEKDIKNMGVEAARTLINSVL